MITTSFLIVATVRQTRSSKAHNRRDSSLISENNWPTRSGRRRRLSAIRIRDISRSLERLETRMQARCSTSFSGRKEPGVRLGETGWKFISLMEAQSVLYICNRRWLNNSYSFLLYPLLPSFSYLRYDVHTRCSTKTVKQFYTGRCFAISDKRLIRINKTEFN